MNTVNEFKRLLELDFDKIIANLSEAKTNKQALESINRESEKLSQQLLLGGSNVDDDDIVDSDSVDGIRKRHDNDSSNTSEEDSIHPGIDGNHVKTFEDLISIKLQDMLAIQTQPRVESSKSRSMEKRPFLKRGEGLKRFSKGSTAKQGHHDGDSSAKLPVNSPLPAGSSESKPTKSCTSTCRMNAEKLGAKEPFLRGQSTDKSGAKKRTDFARKVVSISSRPAIASLTRSNDIPTLASNLNLNDKYEFEKQFPAGQIDPTNNNKACNFTNGPKNDLSPIQIVKQIGDLEKRLLDLMTLKGQLTQERLDSCPDKRDELASSIELIKNEISTLNRKVSSLSKVGVVVGGEESEEEEKKNSAKDGRLVVDRNSRHFAAPKCSSESSVSTLSNGDKITIGSDQSITYVHSNGTSQTLYRDGMKVIRFPNGQIERIHPGGTKQIIYSDGQQRVIKPDNSEQIILSDGTVYSISADCERIEYQNGDVEWKTTAYTRRHFRNGNIKTIYANGCQETIFSNGRVRMKDRLGNVLFDRAP